MTTAIPAVVLAIYDEKNKFMKLLLEVNNVFGNSDCCSPISVVYSAGFSPAAAASSVF